MPHWEDEDNEATFVQAQCTTAHADGSLCLPLWDGYRYVCSDRAEQQDTDNTLI